jgi:peptidoglycan/xylan/chitin deacetylase (PgdA/CDA1 family)
MPSVTKSAWTAPVCAAAIALALGTLTLAEPRSPEARTLPILVYHQILPTASLLPNGYDGIPRERFESQMRYLKDRGYTTLSMDEVVRFLEGEAFPERSVAIHFDDGWKSHVEAAAILERHGFRGTFWVIPGTGIGEPHLDWPDVEAIAANPRFEIFSHTMTHPWKPRDTMLDWINGRTPGRDIERARWEIAESKRVLESRLGRPAPYLAWPSGHYDDTLVRVAREAGYRALLTIDEGLNSPGGDLLRIRRTMIHGGCDDATFRALVADGRTRDCD